jgi:hypothetical protein
MKILRTLSALLLFAALAFAVNKTVYQYGTLATSLTAVTGTGAGDEFELAIDNGQTHPGKITWEYFFGAAATQPTSHTTTLEGSIDNTNWFTLDTSSSITSVFSSGNAGEMRHVVNKNVRFLRCKITALTINAAVSETCAFMVEKP